MSIISLDLYSNMVFIVICFHAIDLKNPRIVCMHPVRSRDKQYGEIHIFLTPNTIHLFWVFYSHINFCSSKCCLCLLLFVVPYLYFFYLFIYLFCMFIHLCCLIFQLFLFNKVVQFYFIHLNWTIFFYSIKLSRKSFLIKIKGSKKIF